MISDALWLLADAPITTKFEWGRIDSPYDWWICGGVLLAILAPLLWIYRRDAGELPWFLRIGLPLLRTLVLIGLLVVYLQPRWRSERIEHLDSRVLMLVDTSLSMARHDPDVSAGPVSQSRLQQVAAGLDDTEFIARLRKKHDVTVVPFNSVLEKDHRVVLPLEAPPGETSELPPPETSLLMLVLESPWSIPIVGLVLELVLTIVLFLARSRAVLAAMGGVALLALLGVLIQRSVLADREKIPPASEHHVPMVGESADSSAAGSKPATKPPEWRKYLVPGGTDTKLGEALEQLVRDERSTPVSGIVLISDGGLNAGPSPDTAMELARESHIPIYTIGVGSEKKPADVRVADFNVPSRVFPGDRYSVEGSIVGDGMKGKTVRVELLARIGADAKNPARRGEGALIDSAEKVLLGDGEAVPVKFELPPAEVGQHVLCLRVKAPRGSSDASDKYREGTVDCSDHQMHVLLLAGGPLRDYQYLRTLLFRDKSMKLDVLLQSGQTGMSQEATNILNDFPSTRPEMADYDCVVAMDPDWKMLKPEQIEVLFDWVDQDYGGMIAVAGPVYAGRAVEGWVQDPEMTKIRKLYPVEFNRGLSTRNSMMYGSEEPWPLEFTREGLQAPYLWLGDSAIASQANWVQFSGVYSFCPVADKKAGATVLARFSDPRAAQGGQQPIYMAVHRYSASPILYLGSAETWRLRRVDPAMFEQFWTKTIRFVAQDHLRRQSQRGSLSIDNDHYNVGTAVEVRAQLKNSKLQPLASPSVMLYVTRDRLDRKAVLMPADPNRAGRYVVELPVLQPGDYDLELSVPETADEKLHQTFRGVVPMLEQENPQRNAALLREIAEKTQSESKYDNHNYFDDLSVALGSTAPDSLADRLKDVSRTESIPLAPKPEEDENWLKWMLIALCCVLSLEWIVRRLVKLA